MRQEWQTPARQTLIMEIDEAGKLQAWLTSFAGATSPAPDMVKSHLEHWYRAVQMLGGVHALAAEKQGQLKHSTMSRLHAEPMRVSCEMDALRRHQQNANSIHAIRDIALSRALNAADKSMLGKPDLAASPNYSVFMAPQQLLTQDSAATLNNQ